MRDSMHLHRIDPDRNMARFYSMSVQPNLFGESALLGVGPDRQRRPARVRPLRLRAGGRSGHGAASQSEAQQRLRGRLSRMFCLCPS